MPIDLGHIEKYSAFELKAKQIVEGFLVGLHKSPFHGFSVEFSEHRFYNPGESTKNIDWKLLARTDKYFVKKYEEETNLRCSVLVDVSSSMQFPVERSNSDIDSLNKLGYALHGAASIITLLQKQRDAAGLICFSDRVELKTEVKSSGLHKRYLIGELNRFVESDKEQSAKRTRLSDIISEVAGQIHKRSLVVLFTDFLNNTSDEVELSSFFQSLEHLKHNKNEIIVFHVYHSALEKELSFKNKPHKFVDLETGEELKLNPSEFKEAYKQQMEAQFSIIKYELENRGVDFVPVNIELGLEEVLLPYFLKRTKLQ